MLIIGVVLKKNIFFYYYKLVNYSATERQIKGLYVYGGVGCGKTMVMDMFYDSISTQSKLRIHFHDFMLDVHERIHKFKSSLPPSHVKDVSRKSSSFYLNYNYFQTQG